MGTFRYSITGSPVFVGDARKRSIGAVEESLFENLCSSGVTEGIPFPPQQHKCRRSMASPSWALPRGAHGFRVQGLEWCACKDTHSGAAQDLCRRSRLFFSCLLSRDRLRSGGVFLPSPQSPPPGSFSKSFMCRAASRRALILAGADLQVLLPFRKPRLSCQCYMGLSQNRGTPLVPQIE